MGSVIEQLEARAEEAVRQADRLKKMVELARELGDEGLAELAVLIAPAETNGHTNGNGNGNGHAARVKPDGPRGRAAVRLIVKDRPGLWTLKDLRAEMEQNGWFTSTKGLDVAVKRLCDNGEARWVAKGQYEFPANGKEGTIESDASDGALIPLTL